LLEETFEEDMCPETHPNAYEDQSTKKWRCCSSGLLLSNTCPSSGKNVPCGRKDFKDHTNEHAVDANIISHSHTGERKCTNWGKFSKTASRINSNHKEIDYLFNEVHIGKAKSDEDDKNNRNETDKNLKNVRENLEKALNKTNEALINSTRHMCLCKSLDLGVLVNEPFKRCDTKCEKEDESLKCIRFDKDLKKYVSDY
jgi:hypothetical protein